MPYNYTPMADPTATLRRTALPQEVTTVSTALSSLAVPVPESPRKAIWRSLNCSTTSRGFACRGTAPYQIPIGHCIR